MRGLTLIKIVSLCFCVISLIVFAFYFNKTKDDFYEQVIPLSKMSCEQYIDAYEDCYKLTLRHQTESCREKYEPFIINCINPNR